MVAPSVFFACCLEKMVVFFMTYMPSFYVFFFGWLDYTFNIFPLSQSIVCFLFGEDFLLLLCLMLLEWNAMLVDYHSYTIFTRLFFKTQQQTRRNKSLASPSQVEWQRVVKTFTYTLMGLNLKPFWGPKVPERGYTTKPSPLRSFC